MPIPFFFSSFPQISFYVIRYFMKDKLKVDNCTDSFPLFLPSPVFLLLSLRSFHSPNRGCICDVSLMFPFPNFPLKLLQLPLIFEFMHLSYHSFPVRTTDRLMNSAHKFISYCSSLQQLYKRPSSSSFHLFFNFYFYA